MKLIVGLGNPGKQYAETRHNVGFMILDFLQSEWGFPAFTANKRFTAEISEGMHEAEKVILIKPATFMNLSGAAVRSILDFYKLTPADVFVVQDELDIPFGTHRLAIDSSAAGHNGIKNIIEHLGTQRFVRLRIGIATPEQSTVCLCNAHEFVLDRFTAEERAALEKLLPVFVQIADEWIRARVPESSIGI